MKKLSAIVLSLLFVCFAFAGRVLVEWGHSPSPGVEGYKIHWGTNSREYPFVLDVGYVTNAIVENLSSNLSWYFAATAYTTNGLPSDYSEEASIWVPSTPQPVVSFTATLQSAETISDPDWTNIYVWETEQTVTNGSQFFRVLIGVELVD